MREKKERKRREVFVVWLCSLAYLADLLVGLRLHVGEDVALGQRQDLEGHGAVMVLQRRDVIIPHS